jgi:hypothetical protein
MVVCSSWWAEPTSPEVTNLETWKPITDEEFATLFEEQYGELDEKERRAFDRFRVEPWKATIRRSEIAGDELVFVVAEVGGRVLYYDDVEDGFNISPADEFGRILRSGGSSNTLQEAVNRWFPIPE